MTLSFDRLNFLQREGEMRQDDLRRLRNTIERKIARMSKDISKTHETHRLLKADFLENRFAITPRKFVDFVSTIRASRQHQRELKKSIDGMTRQSNLLARQLAFYEKKLEIVAKKKNDHQLLQKGIAEEAELENMQMLAVCRQRKQETFRVMPVPSRVIEQPSPYAASEPVLMSTPLSNISLGEVSTLPVVEKEAIREGADVELEIQEETQAMMGETGKESLVDFGSRSGFFSSPIDCQFQDSKDYPSHSGQDSERTDNAVLQDDRSTDEPRAPFEEAKHWQDEHGNHHLVFHFALSAKEHVQVAIERRRQNHLSLILIADREENIPLERLRVKIGARLATSGFKLESLRVVQGE